MQRDNLTDEARGWAKVTLEKLKAELVRLGVIHRERSPSKQASIEQVRTSVRTKSGVLSSIAFKFPRHLVFVHKGVGRGHPASDPRTPKPWFNEVVEKEVETLADIVAENAADRIVSDSFDRLKIH